jgi:hypothetical protein
MCYFDLLDHVSLGFSTGMFCRVLHKYGLHLYRPDFTTATPGHVDSDSVAALTPDAKDAFHCSIHILGTSEKFGIHFFGNKLPFGHFSALYLCESFICKLFA